MVIIKNILPVVVTFYSLLLSATNFNLQLIHHIDEVTEANSGDNFGVSDIWGYTDEAGNEYAIIGYRYGTYIYKVNVPSPELIMDISGPSGGDYYYHRDYKTIGDYLYIVNEMYGLDEGVQIIDLSPLPENTPVKLSTYQGVRQSHNLWIDASAELAFIEYSYPDNIHVLDVSNPESPMYLSDFRYNDGVDCHDIYTVNNRAYVSEGWSYQYGIYDITNIADPVRLATIPAFGYAHNAWLNATGTYLITTEETVGMTIKIWDIQDLGNINLVGEYLGENDLAHNVHVKEDLVYISHYTTGLKIIDIFNPEDPIEVAAYDTYPQNDYDGFYGCWGAFPFTKNGFVYASDMQNGLFILDHGDIQAGWITGILYDNGNPVANAELLSELSGKSFFTNTNGTFTIGHAQGEHSFQIIVEGAVLDNTMLGFSAHEFLNHDIHLGNQGDLNADGEINILDIVLLVKWVLEEQYNVAGDLNNDEALNILDIVQLVNLILQL